MKGSSWIEKAGKRDLGCGAPAGWRLRDGGGGGGGGGGGVWGSPMGRQARIF